MERSSTSGQASKEIAEVDIGGDVVVPTFIESHIHMEKALLERVRPNKEGTLREP